MDISIKRIQIQNFKGTAQADYDLQGRILRISGANHTGKTTIADAFFWVLFGRDSLGRAEFGIDPRDSNARRIDNLDNEVTLTLLLNGQPTTFRKRRSQRWVTRRGVSTPQLDGHTTACFIDGTPLTATDYAARVSEIIPEATLRAVTNPAYFPSLNAEQRIQLLAKIVPPRPLSEIADGKPAFQQILTEAQGRTLDDFKKAANNEAKLCREEAKAITPRLKELTELRQHIDQQHHDYDSARQRIAQIDQLIKQHDSAITDASTAYQQQQAQWMEQAQLIAALKNEAAKIAQQARHEDNEKRKKFDEMVLNATNDLRTAEAKERDLEQQLTFLKQQEENLDKRTIEFRQRWDYVELMHFQWDTDKDFCPTCGQHLPADKTADARNKAEIEFNERKAHLQDNLDIEAQAIKDEVHRIATQCHELSQEAQAVSISLPEYRRKLDTIKKQRPTVQDYTKLPKYVAVLQQIEKLQEDLDQKRAAFSPSDTAKQAQQQRSALLQERTNLQAVLYDADTAKQYTERIKAFQSKMQQLSSEATRYDQQVQDIEKLQQAAATDFQTRVNALFPTVRILMMHTYLNGNERRACIITQHGVPYESLSYSEKVNCGLEIVNALSRYQDFTAPVFIDNAEAINQITPTDGQQIQLAVNLAQRIHVSRLDAQKTLFDIE